MQNAMGQGILVLNFVLMVFGSIISSASLRHLRSVMHSFADSFTANRGAFSEMKAMVEAASKRAKTISRIMHAVSFSYVSLMLLSCAWTW